jgi:hypothetical protein
MKPWAGSMVQEVEHLSNKWEALSSSSSTTKKERKGEAQWEIEGHWGACPAGDCRTLAHSALFALWLMLCCLTTGPKQWGQSRTRTSKTASLSKPFPSDARLRQVFGYSHRKLTSTPAYSRLRLSVS